MVFLSAAEKQGLTLHFKCFQTPMAFRIVRQRKEARRNAKLEEIFQERDKAQKGVITFEQLVEIFRIYEVNLDENKAAKLKNEEGNIAKADFIQFAKDNHLLDFDSVLGEVALLLSSPRKGRRGQGKSKDQKIQGSRGQAAGPESKSLWSRFRDPPPSTEPPNVDKVELAFNKFDLDKDGFLSWEEFSQFGKNMEPDQALRIFNSCEQAEKGKVSLDEFRRLVASRPPLSPAPSVDQVEPEKEKSDA